MDEAMGYKHSSPEPESSQNDSPQKRTASEAALDNNDGRATRKRAAKACQSCRSRKVRCSVSDHGVPCYNCKLDELECIIPERKRPTRTAKRDKSLGAVISEAVLRMDSSTPDAGSVQSDIVRRPSSATIPDDWEGNFGYSIDTPPNSTGSPAHFASEHTELEKAEFVELPPCDEELARWFSVMPARVVDKMFEYLTLLSQYGQGDSLSPRPQHPKFKPNEKVRLIPPGNSTKRKTLSPEVQDHLRYHMASQQNLYPSSRPLEPPSPQSPTEDACQLALHDPQRNISLLKQLRDSHAAASRTMSTLEATIRKVDAQLTNRREPRFGSSPPNCRVAPPTCAFPHSLASTKKTPPTLTPPPENQSAYAMSIQTLQQLEKLFAPAAQRDPAPSHTDYRNPQSQQNGLPAKPEGALDGLNDGLGGRGEDFEETFDSLIDFGGEDSLFQLV
ncbi:hypothetical protein CIRG_06513 [Coccidioides immitis RMSCC 2394]|uniref:Zn(2)-C6 fungal-type domain-containing protein n=1 Tax=Coccidioides immitis RMSCC 2394 TaxID=404692 RepID=A0A0J7B9X5_COCIT|nr:hypothetical protein CIRG_06513 [Coccidioides immitis RMSCC 2394]